MTAKDILKELEDRLHFKKLVEEQMNLKDTIKYVEIDDNGRTVFISGSCKAKDLRRK